MSPGAAADHVQESPVIRTAIRPLNTKQPKASAEDTHHTHSGEAPEHAPRHSTSVYPTPSANNPTNHNPVTAMIAQITVDPVSSVGRASLRGSMSGTVAIELRTSWLAARGSEKRPW
jgi:hypothetical protein